MPRHARVLLPGLPHHVTQRGNHRERVFFANGDEQAYLALLQSYTAANGVRVIAYCLMPNHVHLVVVPDSPGGLQFALRAVHSQYAQRINRMRQLKGHLWQGRYFSSALDPAYYRNAVRYTERNPVRARMISSAERYPWSSAAAHCGLRCDPLLAPGPLPDLFPRTMDWADWLAKEIAVDSLDALRRHGQRNLPCGSADFVSELERATGRDLRFRPRGRPPKRGASPFG